MKKKTFAKMAALPLVPFITLCWQSQAKAATTLNTQKTSFGPKENEVLKKTSGNLYNDILEELQKEQRVEDSSMIAANCY